MKYVKSISLFFVYPLCCFLAGLLIGLWNDVPGKVKEPLLITEQEPEIVKNHPMPLEQVPGQDSEMTSGKYVISQLQQPKQQEIQPFTTQTENQNEFYAKNVDDFVVVFHQDGTTVFLSTGICVSDLPKEVQEELESGMLFPDEGALYDFLENYTS